MSVQESDWRKLRGSWDRILSTDTLRISLGVSTFDTLIIIFLRLRREEYA